MTSVPSWWSQPRRVAVVVDNPSWIAPFGEQLTSLIAEGGDNARFCVRHDEIVDVDIVFYIGCIRISPPHVLARAKRNLVVHESDLPKGRGMSPLTWQIIEGESEIPICLLEAADAIDAGPVIYRDRMYFEGHELIDELRYGQAQVTMDLCRRFLSESEPVSGTEQSGAASIYQRRTPEDSALDPEISIAKQFDLLRTVDNNQYPAFFDLNGHRYKLQITKVESDEQG